MRTPVFGDRRQRRYIGGRQHRDGGHRHRQFGAVAVEHGATLRRGIEGARALFVNEYEFGLVEKITGLTREDVLQQVEFLVIRLGSKGAQIVTRETEIQIPVFPPNRIQDPTGVGDAFRGGFLVGYSQGWSLEMCGKMGALAATYCLENMGPQGHQYTTAEYVARFRTFFDDQGILDQLIK